MKKYIGIILPVLFFILNSCGHEVQKASEDNFTPPALKVQPRLIYPKVAQENNYSGTSKLLLRITKEGTVDKVSIVKSSGYRVLDDAAMDYCKNLIFYPAQVNGRPIDSRIEWELKFQFTDQNWSVHNYITDIEYFYKRISQVKSNDRNNIQKEILIKHNQFVTNIGIRGRFHFYYIMILSKDFPIMTV